MDRIADEEQALKPHFQPRFFLHFTDGRLLGGFSVLDMPPGKNPVLPTLLQVPGQENLAILKKQERGPDLDDPPFPGGTHPRHFGSDACFAACNSAASPRSRSSRPNPVRAEARIASGYRWASAARSPGSRRSALFSTRREGTSSPTRPDRKPRTRP